MKRLATVLLVLIPSAALADEAVVLPAPTAGATLTAGPLDLSLFTVADGPTLDVVGTYVADAAPGEPTRFVVSLADGERATRRLPGAAYTFTRDGAAVRAEVAGVAVTELVD